MKRALVIGSSILALASCGELGGDATGNAIGNLACPELRGGAENASFEADARANATIRAFVTAAGDLAAVAAAAENEVGSACERMGRDLSVPPEQMMPQEGQNRVAAACNAVAARIDGIARAGATVRAEYSPPQCQVRGDVEASCKGQCQAQLDPGYVKANCQPGHLYGQCQATCTGRCDGACQGQCQGTTSNGVCNGTCTGQCSGDCHGSCSVDFAAPKCDVAMQGPSADARCDASCHAHADLTAQCTPPRLNVTASASTGEMAALVGTLQANLPALLTAEIAYGQRIGPDIEVLVRTGGELPNAFGQLTAHAGACIAAAANACVSAQASLRVSVQASASISAKAGASGTLR